MSPQAAMITSLPMAFEMLKSMQDEGLEWGEGYRPPGRQVVAATSSRLPLRSMLTWPAKNREPMGRHRLLSRAQELRPSK